MERFRALAAHTRRSAWIVAALAVVVHLNTLGNRFAYDDYHIVANNTAIQSIETLPGAVFSPYWPGMFGRENGLWRPTTQVLFGVQWIASGGAPWLFHLVNVLAHAAVTVLVLLLLRELLSPAAALAGALIFAVHPVHVEAVANIVGLGELLSAAFFLWACLVHVRGPPETTWRRAFALGVLYALAFGAKEGAATLPGALFLLDAARGRLAPSDLPRYIRDRWRAYLALVASAAALLAVRFEILGRVADPLQPLGADLLLEIPRIWTVAEVWGHYVRLWVFPLDLSSDYAPNVIPISTGWHLSNTVGAVLTLAILVSALLAWRRGPAMSQGEDSARVAGFAVVWFLVIMSPVLNVFFLAGVLLAERTLYLPSVGLAAATAWLFLKLSAQRPRLAIALLLVGLSLSAVRSWVRNPTWKDNPTMLNALVGDYPHSGRSQWVLGDAFMDRGRTNQALRTYRIAIDVLDSHYLLMTEVGQTLMRHELHHGAEGLLLHAWRRDPRFALAPGVLAELYSDLGRPEEAERMSRVALEIEDRDPLRPHIITWSLAARGRMDEAARAREDAVSRQGTGNYWQQWLTLAYLDAHEGDTAAAGRAVEAALAIGAPTFTRAMIDSVGIALTGVSRLDSLVTPDAPEGEPNTP